jgi:hypothetical protein
MMKTLLTDQMKIGEAVYTGFSRAPKSKNLGKNPDPNIR